MTFLQYLRQLNEVLTILPNEGDELEKNLYRRLLKNLDLRGSGRPLVSERKEMGTDKRDSFADCMYKC